MKRYCLIIWVLLCCLTVRAQSVAYTLHYWFDENHAQKQSTSLGNGLFLLDSESLSEGLHCLHVLLEGNNLTTTQSYLFLKVQAQPSVSDNLTLHYWFDENDAEMQSNDLGEGLFLLDADDLSEGLHALHVLLEGDGLTTTRTYLFMKMQSSGIGDNLTFRYWFDENDAEMQSNELGDGLFLLNADGLELGFHDLHVLLEGNGATTTQTYRFVKLDSGICVFNGNVDVYWSNIENWSWNSFPQAGNGALINGICQLDEDATLSSLTVAEEQSFTIPAERTLTVSGILTSEEASRLVIEEGGQLMHGNDGVQATVQKTIMPYTEGEENGWHLIASPLEGTTGVTSVVNLLNNEYDLYYYDEPTYYWMNQEYASNDFTDMLNGKGYLYANNEEVMLEFAGVLKSGSAPVTVPLDYTETVKYVKGFNLVGNPFAHKITTYASENVADGCFVMNDNKDDFIVSEISEANPLKPAEGFFVKATAADASITFNPERGLKASRSGSIRLEVMENGKIVDRLIVRKDGETLEKLSLKANRTKLFAQRNHQEMSIVPYEGDELAVSFKAGKSGNYTIQVSIEGLEFDYLHLIDNLTGADTDLLETPSYTFVAKTTDYASRFRLVFSKNEEDDSSMGSEAFAYFNGNEWVVSNMGGATLQVVDMLGHILSSKTISDEATLNLKAAPGVYMIRLMNGEDVKTQKIVVW